MILNVILQRYLARVQELFKLYTEAEVKHVPLGEYTRVNVISKLASTRPSGNNRLVIQETFSLKSIGVTRKGV